MERGHDILEVIFALLFYAFGVIFLVGVVLTIAALREARREGRKADVRRGLGVLAIGVGLGGMILALTFFVR